MHQLAIAQQRLREIREAAVREQERKEVEQEIMKHKAFVAQASPMVERLAAKLNSRDCLGGELRDAVQRMRVSLSNMPNDIVPTTCCSATQIMRAGPPLISHNQLSVPYHTSGSNNAFSSSCHNSCATDAEPLGRPASISPRMASLQTALSQEPRPGNSFSAYPHSPPWGCMAASVAMSLFPSLLAPARERSTIASGATQLRSRSVGSRSHAQCFVPSPVPEQALARHSGAPSLTSHTNPMAPANSQSIGESKAPATIVSNACVPAIFAPTNFANSIQTISVPLGGAPTRGIGLNTNTLGEPVSRPSSFVGPVRVFAMNAAPGVGGGVQGRTNAQQAMPNCTSAAPRGRTSTQSCRVAVNCAAGVASSPRLAFGAKPVSVVAQRNLDSMQNLGQVGLRNPQIHSARLARPGSRPASPSKALFFVQGVA